jgi:transglutaminase-like putative cysteine protease
MTGARGEREDIFGNRVLYFAIQEPHGELIVTATSEVEITHAPALYDPSRSFPWEQTAEWLRQGTSAEEREARQFVLDSPCAAASADLRSYALPSFPPGRPVLEAVHDLSARIHREFAFDPQSTTVTSP